MENRPDVVSHRFDACDIYRRVDGRRQGDVTDQQSFLQRQLQDLFGFGASETLLRPQQWQRLQKPAFLCAIVRELDRG